MLSSHSCLFNVLDNALLDYIKYARMDIGHTDTGISTHTHSRDAATTDCTTRGQTDTGIEERKQGPDLPKTWT